MALRFRKSFRIFPGARINVSKTGVSLSLGAPGATINVSGRGVRGTVGVPGTGLSHTTQLSGSGSQRSHEVVDESEDGPVVWAPGSWRGDVEHFRSGPTADLTSRSLTDLRELMCTAEVQKKEAASRLSEVEQRLEELAREQRCKSVFLWSWAFSTRLEALPSLLEEAEDEKAELEAWLEGTGAPVEFTMDDALKDPVELLESALDKLTGIARLWDVTTRQDVDPRERSAASNAIAREPVSAQRRHTDWVDTEKPGVQLGNANGDPLVFYPGFLLVDGGPANGPALVSYEDLQVRFSVSKMLEEEGVPSDAQVLGMMWAKVNKDGSRDKRFKDNYQIPIAAYGRVELRTPTGLHEVYSTSDAGAGMLFAMALIMIRLGTVAPDRLDEMADAVNAAKNDPMEMVEVLERFARA